MSKTQYKQFIVAKFEKLKSEMEANNGMFMAVSKAHLYTPVFRSKYFKDKRQRHETKFKEVLLDYEDFYRFTAVNPIGEGLDDVEDNFKDEYLSYDDMSIYYDINAKIYETRNNILRGNIKVPRTDHSLGYLEFISDEEPCIGTMFYKEYFRLFFNNLHRKVIRPLGPLNEEQTSFFRQDILDNLIKNSTFIKENGCKYIANNPIETFKNCKCLYDCIILDQKTFPETIPFTEDFGNKCPDSVMTYYVLYNRNQTIEEYSEDKHNGKALSEEEFHDIEAIFEEYYKGYEKDSYKRTCETIYLMLREVMKRVFYDDEDFIIINSRSCFELTLYDGTSRFMNLLAKMHESHNIASVSIAGRPCKIPKTPVLEFIKEFRKPNSKFKKAFMKGDKKYTCALKVTPKTPKKGGKDLPEVYLNIPNTVVSDYLKGIVEYCKEAWERDIGRPTKNVEGFTTFAMVFAIILHKIQQRSDYTELITSKKTMYPTYYIHLYMKNNDINTLMLNIDEEDTYYHNTVDIVMRSASLEYLSTQNIPYQPPQQGNDKVLTAYLHNEAIRVTYEMNLEDDD